jgi:hypothetical protein
LGTASPLSGAGENTNAEDVEESKDEFQKILTDIGEDDNPFNGNGGFGEW